MSVGSDVPMAPRHIHLTGAAADHAEWGADPVDDDFDADALEAAMIEARDQAYRALATIDAA